MIKANLPAARLVGAAWLSLAASASAQTVFSDNFNNSPQNNSISDNGGWVTNDKDNGDTYSYSPSVAASIGQSEVVGFIPNFTNGGAADQSAELGGMAPSVLPGQALVQVSHSLALGGAATASFNLDFGVSSSGDPMVVGSYSARDTFAFSFLGAGGGPLFSINFTPTGDGGRTFDNIGYTSGANTAVSNSLLLNTRFHLAVNVDLVNRRFDAFLDATQVAAGVSYVGGTITDFAARWSLANSSTGTGSRGSTAYLQPGSNNLAFDNLVVAVPEPSTYALIGVSVLGFVWLRRRSLQRA